MEPMRRNASTVVVLAGSAPGEVLAAVGQSMNVTLIRPDGSAAGSSDGSSAGSGDGDSGAMAAAKALAAWRAGRFELPDYYLVLAAYTGAGAGVSPGVGPGVSERGPDFYLGPLRSARPHRVAVVAATEPRAQAVGVLQALGSLRHGPWWPGLDDVIEAARGFYPDSLAEPAAALGAAAS
jgi:hypothetical protein